MQNFNNIIYWPLDYGDCGSGGIIAIKVQVHNCKGKLKKIYEAVVLYSDFKTPNVTNMKSALKKQYFTLPLNTDFSLICLKGFPNLFCLL